MSDSSNISDMSESQLRAQIEESRQKLSESLAQLTYEMQPKVQASYVAEGLKYRAKEAQYNVANTVDDAREGDPEAVRKVLISAGVAAGVFVLGVIRHKIKKRRKG